MKKWYYILALLLALVSLNACTQTDTIDESIIQVPENISEIQHQEKIEDFNSLAHDAEDAFNESPYRNESSIHEQNAASTALLQYKGGEASIVYPECLFNGTMPETDSDTNQAQILLSFYPTQLHGDNVLGTSISNFSAMMFTDTFVYNITQNKSMLAAAEYPLPGNRFAASKTVEDPHFASDLPGTQAGASSAYTIYDEDITMSEVQLDFDFVKDENSSGYIYKSCGFGYSPSTDEYFMLYKQVFRTPGQTELSQEDKALKIAWFDHNGRRITGDTIVSEIEGIYRQVFAYPDPVIPLTDSLFLLDPFDKTPAILLDTANKSYTIEEDIGNTLSSYPVRFYELHPIQYFREIPNPPFQIVRTDDTGEIMILDLNSQKVIASLPDNYYLADWQDDGSDGYTALFGVFETNDFTSDNKYDNYIAIKNEEFIDTLLQKQDWDFRSEQDNNIS